MSFIPAFVLVVTILKFMGFEPFINWSWWLVLAPVWIAVLVITLLWLVAFVIFLFVKVKPTRRHRF